MLALQREEQTITFDRTDYVLTSEDYGAIEATHSTAKGVEQVGERIVSTALDTRDVEIVGFIRAGSNIEMRNKKSALYQLCDPRYTFTILVDHNIALEVRATETVRFTPSKLTNNNRVASFAISAVALDPLFRDAVAKEQKTADWISNFSFPLVIPQEGFTFAEREEDITAFINAGDVETGLMIYFEATAGVENPVLTNVETGEYIKLNHTFVTGETVVINTNYGRESVTGYVGDEITNLINSFDLGSTFLQAPPGESRLHFAAESGAQSMTVTIQYYQRYLGV